MKTVYYLIDWRSNHRIRYYTTLTGARIACRLRNLHLGFLRRTEYQELDGRTYELCTTAGDHNSRGTYCIEEDTIDTPDLLE